MVIKLAKVVSCVAIVALIAATGFSRADEMDQEFHRSKAPRVSEVDSCHSGSEPAKKVLFFKQWHLSPSKKTTDIEAAKELPQYQNQKALYEELDQEIADGKIHVLIAEGCPSPRAVDSSSPEQFNGWSMAALEKVSHSSEYSDILTNIAYKLEAKWKGRLRVLCGDDEVAIKKELLAFSDARGTLGYLSRLQQYRGDPEQAKGYLEDVVRLFHMNSKVSVDEAIQRLQSELKKSVSEILKWNAKRDAQLAKAIQSDPAPVLAVVFGGVHAGGVREALEKNKIGCTIYQPVGYRDDESDLLASLKKLVQ